MLFYYTLDEPLSPRIPISYHRGLMIDAGSGGSRIHIFSWKPVCIIKDVLVILIYISGDSSHCRHQYQNQQTVKFGALVAIAVWQIATQISLLLVAANIAAMM